MLRRAWLAVVLIALGAAACTGPEPGPTDTASVPGTVTSQPSVSVGPGGAAFHYDQGLGLTATLTFDEGEGRLTLENATGRTVGAPGVYALDRRTGERADATVSGPPSVEDGSAATYSVSFDGGFDAAASAGLVALTIGGDDVGAFVPLSG